MALAARDAGLLPMGPQAPAVVNDHVDVDGVLSAVVAVLPATCYDDVLLRRAAACADFSEWHGMAALALVPNAA